MLLYLSKEKRTILSLIQSTACPYGLQAAAGNVDWTALLRSSTLYRLAPLIYVNLKRHALKSRVPPEVWRGFEGIYFGVKLQNRARFRTLSNMLRVFSQNGIDVVLLKGAALAPFYYLDLGVRSMVDIDILVKTSKLDAVELLLLENGFAAAECRHTPQWYKECHHHLVPYRSPDNSLNIEVHHHIVGGEASMVIPVSDFWNRAVPIMLEGLPAWILSPEDMLLHLALHISLRSAFIGAIRDLCDIGVIVERAGAGFDWKALVRRAQSYEVDRHVYYALWLADHFKTMKAATGLPKQIGCIRRQGFLEDGIVKATIEKVVFINPYDKTLVIPAWLMLKAYTVLVSRGSLGSKLLIFLTSFFEGLCDSASQIVEKPKAFALAYALIVHPFFLTGRAFWRWGKREVEKLLSAK